MGLPKEKVRLFFETSIQAEAFLFTMPLGFLVAACFDLTSFASKGRVLVDVLLMLLCAAALLTGIALMGEAGLRLYHLLALLIGALLYTQGIGRVFKALRAWFARRRSAEHTPPKSN